MMTIICLIILVYCMKGKDIRSKLGKLKNVDWKEKGSELMLKCRPYAKRVGRMAAKPLLQFYFVMMDEKTSTADKALIYAAIFYTVSPVSLIPASVFKLLGVMDEGAAILFVYKKVKEKITPEINQQVDSLLDEWFRVDKNQVLQ